MADISNELAKILTEETGEGVRSSIYNGLLKMNNEVINNKALVDGLNDVLVEQTGVDISAFEQYRAGVSISIAGASNDYYMLPGLLLKNLDDDSWDLCFTVNLPHPFIPSSNGYSISIRSLSLGLSMYAIDSDGFKQLAPYTDGTYQVSNGNLGDHIVSCTGVLSNYRDKIHVKLTFDSTALTIAPLTGTHAVCFIIPAAFSFRADENPAT
jgi:hypothetical protein